MNNQLEFLPNEKRLEIYQILIEGTQHLYSKGKLDKDKALHILPQFVKLGFDDPIFLAHLTSYLLTKSDNRDLQIISTYANSLSSADGMPFSKGGKIKKPNLRYVSAAAVQMLTPKQVYRLLEIANLKFEVPGLLPYAKHFPTHLKTAIIRYVKYREKNLKILQGIKKAGLGNIFKNIYRNLHISPSDESASILRWKQKDGRNIKIFASQFDFSGMKDIEIAKKIRREKLPVLSVLGALPHVSPVIAVALLEQATPNQALILRKTFEDLGLLKDKDVLSLFTEKIKGAKQSIDRVENLSKTASEEVKKILKNVKSEVRKSATVNIGKIFLHLDISGSMHATIDWAKKNAAIIAEMVNNPSENFAWGAFNKSGKLLPLPQEFTEDGFSQVLFGIKPEGYTNCFALYDHARKFGADVDIYITDQEHNSGTLLPAAYHSKYPNIAKPKCCVVIDFSYKSNNPFVVNAYQNANIPVTVLKPEKLSDTSLIVESINQALLGPIVLIDSIMNTPLLKLPDWYLSLKKS